MTEREAYCNQCGPTRANEHGCIWCADKTCERCGDVRIVIVTLAATSKQPEQRLCVPCWSKA